MSDGRVPETWWSVDVPRAGGGSIDVVANGLLVRGPGWLGVFSFKGERRWLAEAVTDTSSWPVLLDTESVAQIEQGSVVIRDCGTGALRSRWAAPGASRLAVAPWGDVVFLQVGEGRKRTVRCLTRDGRERWAVPLTSGMSDSPWTPFAVSDVVVIARSGGLWAYDESGAVRWVAGRAGVREPSALAADDRVKLYGDAIEIDRNRALAWLSWYDGGSMVEIDGRGPVMRTVAERSTLELPVAVLHALSGDYRLAGFRGQIDNGHMDYVYPIRVLNADGTLVWEHQLPARPRGLAPAAGGGVVVGASPSPKVWREYGKWQDLSRQTFVRLVDAAGAEVWTWYAPGLVTQSPVAGPDGTVYVGSEGRLYALATPGRTV
jgi:hypothetical protein